MSNIHCTLIWQDEEPNWLLYKTPLPQVVKQPNRQVVSSQSREAIIGNTTGQGYEFPGIVVAQNIQIGLH